MKTARLITLALCLALSLPLIASAQEAADPQEGQAQTDITTTGQGDVNFSDTYAYQRDGIFGCSLNGSYSMSVGALSATGGVYVPVNDAAVTLNTGYLVYKECVLRGIVNRMRESSTSALQKIILTVYQRGRGGQPLFSQSLPNERLSTTDKATLDFLQNGVSSLNPALAGPVTRAVAQGYMKARNAASTPYSCSYGNLNTLYSNRSADPVWTALSAIRTPGCLPDIAYLLADEARGAFAASRVSDMTTQLEWGQGTYPIYGTDENGNEIVLTPSSIVQSNTLQALQTGFRQLENANDIDQMVGALFAGITTHVVNDSRGLAGLTQSSAGKLSYLDQVAKESAQGVRDSAVNAAIRILTASRQVEAGYKAAMEAIANMLTNTIADIRGKEKACWNLIIQKTCSGALKADGTCDEAVCTTDPATGQQTCTASTTLQVATSTIFSQRVVGASIAPLATTTAQNIRASNTALGRIDDLLQKVTNTTALTAQREALQQLDALVVQKALHTQYDMQAAQEQQKTVASQMAQLIQDTATAWGDSTDTQTGWCNVNRTEVIDAWKTCWRKGSTTCIFPK